MPESRLTSWTTEVQQTKLRALEVASAKKARADLASDLELWLKGEGAPPPELKNAAKIIAGERAAAASYLAFAATRGTFHRRLGCGSRWVRGLWERAQWRSCWRSEMRNTCASAGERCRAGARKRHAETGSSLSVFFGLGLGAVHQRSGGGSEAVEMPPLDRFTEDGSQRTRTHGFFSARLRLCRRKTQLLRISTIA